MDTITFALLWLQVVALFPLVRFTTPAALKPTLSAALAAARAKMDIVKLMDSGGFSFSHCLLYLGCSQANSG